MTLQNSERGSIRKRWLRGLSVIVVILITFVTISTFLIHLIMTSCSALQSQSLVSVTQKTTLSSTKRNSLPPWKSILSQLAPSCNNPDGTRWKAPLPATSLSCLQDGSGALVQQSSSNYYAEVDLDSINNKTYSQTTSRVQEDITFQHSSDSSTSAGIIVQTPQAQGVAGGYIFIVNTLGDWRLQQVISGRCMPTVKSGAVHVHAPQTFTVVLTVQQGTLDAQINDQLVVSHYDEKVQHEKYPLAAGLIIESDDRASSLVLFSHFEIDDSS